MERSAQKAISRSLSFPMKVKLKREELLGEGLHGLGEDIGILLVTTIIVIITRFLIKNTHSSFRMTYLIAHTSTF